MAGGRSVVPLDLNIAEQDRAYNRYPHRFDEIADTAPFIVAEEEPPLHRDPDLKFDDVVMILVPGDTPKALEVRKILKELLKGADRSHKMSAGKAAIYIIICGGLSIASVQVYFAIPGMSPLVKASTVFINGFFGAFGVEASGKLIIDKVVLPNILKEHMVRLVGIGPLLAYIFFAVAATAPAVSIAYKGSKKFVPPFFTAIGGVPLNLASVKILHDLFRPIFSKVNYLMAVCTFDRDLRAYRKLCLERDRAIIALREMILSNMRKRHDAWIEKCYERWPCQQVKPIQSGKEFIDKMREIHGGPPILPVGQHYALANLTQQEFGLLKEIPREEWSLDPKFAPYLYDKVQKLTVDDYKLAIFGDKEVRALRRLLDGMVEPQDEPRLYKELSDNLEGDYAFRAGCHYSLLRVYLALLANKIDELVIRCANSPAYMKRWGPFLLKLIFVFLAATVILGMIEGVGYYLGSFRAVMDMRDDMPRWLWYIFMGISVGLGNFLQGVLNGYIAPTGIMDVLRGLGNFLRGRLPRLVNNPFWLMTAVTILIPILIAAWNSFGGAYGTFKQETDLMSNTSTWHFEEGGPRDFVEWVIINFTRILNGSAGLSVLKVLIRAGEVYLSRWLSLFFYHRAERFSRPGGILYRISDTFYKTAVLESHWWKRLEAVCQLSENMHPETFLWMLSNLATGEEVPGMDEEQRETFNVMREMFGCDARFESALAKLRKTQTPMIGLEIIINDKEKRKGCGHSKYYNRSRFFKSDVVDPAQAQEMNGDLTPSESSVFEEPAEVAAASAADNGRRTPTMRFGMQGSTQV